MERTEDRLRRVAARPHPHAGQRVPRAWLARPAVQVAPALLGARLVRLEPDGSRTAGIIVETEAYGPQEDLGCHCRAGPTRRARVLYGPPGLAYVYFAYGMHWLFNVVVAAQGVPAAVLIRALWPTEGLARIAARRGGRPPRTWTDGPAKVCQALDVDGRFHGLDMTAPDAPVFLEFAWQIPPAAVTTGPRVGLNTVPEPWRSVPWRWRVRLPRARANARPRDDSS